MSTSQAYILLVVGSILVTFIGVLGYQTGIKYIGHENTAILSTFEPLMSIISGYIVYKEGFSIRGIVGIILIISSTIIITMSEAKEEKSK